MTTRTHREFFEAVLTILGEVRGRGLHYEVEWRLLDTKYFGIPQSRPRVWVVSRRSDVATRTLQWPTPSADRCRNIDNLLGERPPREQVEHALPTAPGAQTNVSKGLATVRAKGIDPLTETWILEAHQSASRQGNVMKGCSPCLTSTRCKQGGHWISSHGRFFTTGEMLELQHMRRDRLRVPESVTTAKFHEMIGNNMSVNIVEVILAMLSRSTPELFPMGALHDRWSA